MTGGADSTDTAAEHSEMLPLAVAVELATAFATSTATNLGARSLVIKGKVASHYGLRKPRVSADTDILVEPTKHLAVVEALEQLGWRERPMWQASAEASPYSTSLIHDAWPCDIDVHAHFPGFLAAPSDTFDRLWDDRRELDFAGVACPIPGQVGAMLVAALHGVRPSGSPDRAASELAAVGTAIDATDPDTRERLALLAEVTGASGPLAPFLAEHGVTARYELTPELRAWRVLTAGGATYTGNVASTLVGKPLRVKLHLVRLAAWPSADDVRYANPELPDRRSARTWVRLQRLGRGAAQSPKAIAALARSRNQEGDAPHDNAT